MTSTPRKFYIYFNVGFFVYYVLPGTTCACHGFRTPEYMLVFPIFLSYYNQTCAAPSVVHALVFPFLDVIYCVLRAARYDMRVS